MARLKVTYVRSVIGQKPDQERTVQALGLRLGLDESRARYDQRQFRLRVRDDGKGIDPGVLAGDGQPGHYGLPGMHERAKLVGGKLSVWSELDSGTEAELTIPASVAYAKPPAVRRSMASGQENR